MSRPLSLVAGAALTAALLAVLAVPAFGHAILEETHPFDGEVVDASPGMVSLTFDEGIDTPSGGVRVFDSAGNRIDAGDAQVEVDSPQTLQVSIPDDLDDGTYIVTWRAVSADGHPIKGAYLFSIGNDAGVSDDLVANLFNSDDTVPAIAAAVTRAASYLGLFLAAGAALFLVVVIGRSGGDADRRTADRRVALTWLRRGAWLGLAATVLGVPLQAMLVTGLGPLRVFGPTALGDVLGSPFGLSTAVRLVGLAVVLLLVRGEVPPRRDPVLLGAGVVALLGFLLEGHTMTEAPGWLMWLADGVHIVSAAAWLAGLVLLTVLVRSRRRADDPVGAAGLVARFSGLATVTLVALTVAGVAMSWVTVRATRALFDTTYGWTLVVKVGLVALVALAGAYNKRRLVPAVTAAARPVPAGGSTDTAPGDAGGASAVSASAPAAAGSARSADVADGDAAWRTLGRVTRFEALGLVAVLLATGLLVNLQPAAEEAGVTGAYSTYVDLTEDLEVNVVVDPNRAGVNEIHLYVLDRTGRPAADVEDVRLQMTQTAQDIGPIEREPLVAGPGHWVHSGPELSIPGPWLLEVVVGLGRFDEATAEVPVTVNP